jgi:dsDNA-specific endonuclease/ATPase MutS2
VRTLNHLTDIAEALRELQEGLAGGSTRANVAAHLGVTEQEMERIEIIFGGMSQSQIEHVLGIETEVEELRREIADLRQNGIGGERWRGL